jgi:predicted metal-dependent peptidase
MEHMYTPQQRIEQAKVSLFRHPKFSILAGIFMIGDTVIDPEIPTAMTDGKDVRFNPDFVQSLTDAELRGLIYHEYGGHIMYRHLTTFRHLYDQDPMLANMACDYVINQSIKDFELPTFIKLPQGGLQDDRFRGMDSKQVFDLLRAEGADTTDGGFDEHDWDGAKELSADDTRELVKEIDSALRQGAMASTLLGNPVDRELCDWLNPQVDWRETLRDFMTSACSGNDYSTYRRPRRRMMASDIYLPTSVSTTVPSIVIAIDTSMSIDQHQINTFLTEVVELCDVVSPEQVHLMYWDTAVAGHETYTRDMLPAMRDSTKPKGGGGTDVNCVTQYMDEQSIQPACVVVLTDGYLGGSWGAWSCPVLWAITTQQIAEVGTTIRLTL